MPADAARSVMNLCCWERRISWVSISSPARPAGVTKAIAPAEMSGSSSVSVQGQSPTELGE